ncbi:hypothetical protein H4S01_004460 [Coemansia sp. RSA 2610]|nr:hypothetical protein H4S01_004460 [Coemansia sp. RSA 2610]
MGSLSAQIAHVQFLGLQSLTDAAGSWAPEHLASTLLWAQHVDLSWATLAHADRRPTLAAARDLLDSTPASAKLLHTSYFQRHLDMLLPGACRDRILANLLANPAAAHELRALVVQQLAESGASVVQALVDTLADGRAELGMRELSALLSSALESVAENESVRRQVQLYGRAQTYPDMSCERGQYALLLEQTLASPHALLCDAALFACIRQPALLLPEAERVLSALPPANYLQLSAHVLAQLSQISGPIRAAYASGLCALTLQCQRSMLCGEDDSLADQLLERWELITYTTLSWPAANHSKQSPLAKPTKQWWNFG